MNQCLCQTKACSSSVERLHSISGRCNRVLSAHEKKNILHGTGISNLISQKPMLPMTAFLDVEATELDMNCQIFGSPKYKSWDVEALYSRNSSRLNSSLVQNILSDLQDWIDDQGVGIQLFLTGTALMFPDESKEKEKWTILMMEIQPSSEMKEEGEIQSNFDNLTHNTILQFATLILSDIFQGNRKFKPVQVRFEQQSFVLAHEKLEIELNCHVYKDESSLMESLPFLCDQVVYDGVQIYLSVASFMTLSSRLAVLSSSTFQPERHAKALLNLFQNFGIRIAVPALSSSQFSIRIGDFHLSTHNHVDIYMQSPTFANEESFSKPEIVTRKICCDCCGLEECSWIVIEKVFDMKKFVAKLFSIERKQTQSSISIFDLKPQFKISIVNRKDNCQLQPTTVEKITAELGLGSTLSDFISSYHLKNWHRKQFNLVRDGGLSEIGNLFCFLEKKESLNLLETYMTTPSTSLHNYRVRTAAIFQTNIISQARFSFDIEKPEKLSNEDWVLGPSVSEIPQDYLCSMCNQDLSQETNVFVTFCGHWCHFESTKRCPGLLSGFQQSQTTFKLSSLECFQCRSSFSFYSNVQAVS